MYFNWNCTTFLLLLFVSEPFFSFFCSLLRCWLFFFGCRAKVKKVLPIRRAIYMEWSISPPFSLSLLFDLSSTSFTFKKKREKAFISLFVSDVYIIYMTIISFALKWLITRKEMLEGGEGELETIELLLFSSPSSSSPPPSSLSLSV